MNPSSSLCSLLPARGHSSWQAKYSMLGRRPSTRTYQEFTALAQDPDPINRLFGPKAFAKQQPRSSGHHGPLPSRDMVPHLLLRLPGWRFDWVFPVSHLQIYTRDIQIRPLPVGGYLWHRQSPLFLPPFQTWGDESHHLSFHLGWRPTPP